MSESIQCSRCLRNQLAIDELEKRVSALEQEVNGPPVEALLEEFEASRARVDSRTAAIEEYHRLQREEFFEKLPKAREMAERQRAKYEAFMRDRGFEP